MQRIAMLLIIGVSFAACKKDCTCQTTKKITLQPGPSSGRDVTANYNQGNPSSANENGNALAELAIYAWTNGGALVEGKGFISFDLSDIPAGAVITSAKLSLYGPTSSGWIPQGNSGDNSFYVRRVTSSWAQNTLTWNNAPAVSNTNQVLYTPNPGVWNVDAIISVTDLVQDMIDQNQRYGFCLTMATETPYRSVVFSTSEVNDAAKRPKLEITYIH